MLDLERERPPVLAARERDGRRGDRILHVRYPDLVADPVATVDAIYAHSGRPMTRQAEAAMAAYRDSNPQGKHGKVEYSLDEFGLTAIELGFLNERRQAFENLANRVDLEAVRGVVTTMIQTEKYGTPLASALRVLSAEFRHARMMRAEEKAARLPAIMTVPLILFILPVLFVVILGPAACVVALYSGFEAGVIDSLSVVRLDEHLATLRTRPEPRSVLEPADRITVDLRVGGAFVTVMVNDGDGTEYAMRAVYEEVDPPERR